MVTVCTVLPVPERPRLDAAGDGCFTTVHTSSFRDALRAARRKRVDALVLSVHACRGDELPAVARFVREFPAIPAVALVSRHDRNASETLLRLGATGVRSAVDCTEPAGWRRLRDLVGHPASPVAARILARVVHALDLFSNPGLSVADVAYRLDYSSPQSFGRHLKAMLGVTAGEFRRRFPFEVSLERYVDLLITPYRETLRAFCPLNAGLWDQGPNATRVSRPG